MRQTGPVVVRRHQGIELAAQDDPALSGGGRAGRLARWCGYLLGRRGPAAGRRDLVGLPL